MTVIETNNLTKSYGTRRGIENIDLSVRAGEIFGFLGPNGAGKSTAIRVLLGFLRPSSGSARILGHDCWMNSVAIRKQTGYVPGDVRLYSWLTICRALQIVAEIHNSDICQHGLELAEQFQLEPDVPVRTMSRGSRQKAALVLALAPRPQLVILDEPTSGLDPLMQNVLANYLQEMTQEGRTVFFSSHTLSEVETLCRKVAIIRDGSIVACERIETLRSQAPRVLRLTFDSAHAAKSAEFPNFVRLQKCHRNQCELHMDGPAAQVIAWAAQQPITDIDISPPSLEAVFRSYYRESAAVDAR